MKSVKARESSRVGSPDLKIYVNGKIVPSEEATISVFDSGLNFADGVFEGVRVYAGTVFRLDQHVTRGNRFPPRLDPRFSSAEPNIILLGGPISPADMKGQRLVVSSVRQINSD